MCELLGLAFNKPISPGLSFRGFRHRGSRNRDCWVLAAISPTKARVTKEPIRADHSGLSQTLRNEDWEDDLGEEKTPDQKGFVIASRKLTDGEDWQNFRPGPSMVFERGELVYGLND